MRNSLTKDFREDSYRIGRFGAGHYLFLVEFASRSARAPDLPTGWCRRGWRGRKDTCPHQIRQSWNRRDYTNRDRRRDADLYCSPSVYILERHCPGVTRKKNIKEVLDADTIPDSSVSVGGFPCQHVSVARMGPRSGCCAMTAASYAPRCLSRFRTTGGRGSRAQAGPIKRFSRHVSRYFCRGDEMP
jgi:hypothetical protein